MNRIASNAALSLLIALGLFNSVATADDRRDSYEMFDLFRPISKAVDTSVVQVLCGRTPVSLGTIVASDGYILTKRSELTSDPIRIRFHDGARFPARVAAVRRNNDLALLKVDIDRPVKPVQFVSHSPQIASFLVTPGRRGEPLGIGVVGVKERPIGHNGRLGVMLDDDSSGRALVQLVVPQSGADTAGVEPGDRIVAINGREAKSRIGVIERLRGMYPGESVELTILRENESSVLEQIVKNAGIRDLNVLQETESDTNVNGLRNDRLSGFESVIQHDTVLSPHECGGPVLDTSKQVVGINIARAGRVVSYALPSSLVVPQMVSMLKEARNSQ